MADSDDVLSDKQELALGFLLSEKTHERAAEKAGVGSTTLRRWLRQPAFAAAYRDARRSVIEAAVALLQRGASRAAAALIRNTHCGLPAVEVRAAAEVLDNAFRGIELLDLAERIAALEHPPVEKEEDDD